MLPGLVLVGVLVIAAWSGSKLIAVGASKGVLAMAIFGPFVIGFILMRFGVSRAGNIDINVDPLPPLSMFGGLLVIGGLVCGITIAILGILSGMKRHRRKPKQ